MLAFCTINCHADGILVEEDRFASKHVLQGLQRVWSSLKTMDGGIWYFSNIEKG